MLIANEIFYAILNRCLPTCSFYCSYPCRSSAERVQHSTHKKGPHTAFIPELPKTCPFPWPLPDPDSEEDTAFAIGTQTNATDLLFANSHYSSFSRWVQSVPCGRVISMPPEMVPSSTEVPVKPQTALVVYP